MVVLLPMLDGESLRLCSKCGLMGLRSPVKPRSSFYPSKGSFLSECRGCNKKRCIQYQQETGANRIRMAQYRDRLRKDPEAWERFLAQQKVYQQRYRERRESEIRERDRFRQKRKVAVVPKNARSGIVLPVAPFREWIQQLLLKEKDQGNEDAERRVSVALGVATRTVRLYLNDEDEIDECVVDRCCSREGSRMLWELYPEQLEYRP